MYYTLLILFIISRLPFINTNDVFFDSGENIDLFLHHDFFQALISGHFPPHEGYVLLFWPIYQLADLITLNPLLSVVIGQILLATLTIISFYKVARFLSDKRTALIAVIIISLIPIFWITNVTIMMEIAYIAFFFFSFYSLTRYLTFKKTFYLHLAGLSFTFSFLSHMLILLWLPLLLFIVFYKNKKKLLKAFLIFSFYLGFGSILNVLFISAVSNESIPAVFNHLFLAKGNEFASLQMSLHGFLVSMRNFLIPLLRNNTSLIVILGFISLLLLFRKEKKLFMLGVLWIAPAFYTHQWWDSLLNGRHGIIASFGLAFLVAYLLQKRSVIASIVIVYLVFVSIPIMNLLNKPIPYLQQAEIIKSLPQDSLLIDTHFAKPQIERTFTGKVMTVNYPLTSREIIKEEIDKYLAEKKLVFISSGALSEPYGLYSGPYLHNITLSYAKSFEMEPVITNYTLKLYKIINTEDNLILYQIISTEPSAYPPVPSLRDSSRRLDYYDPLSKLFWLDK